MKNEKLQKREIMFSIIYHFDIILKILILGLIFPTTKEKNVHGFTLDYPSFPRSKSDEFIQAKESYIMDDTLQVTRDTNVMPNTNISGKIVYHEPFKLWNQHSVASFNSTFVMNIIPAENGGGEGLAFILSRDSAVPDNSQGQWLGIVNATTNGSSEGSVVAIEFDTKKSFPEDVDGNHVGLNINSVYSERQFSLNMSDIVIANGRDYDLTVMVIYNGSSSMMNVYVFKGRKAGSDTTRPMISMPVNLSQYLPSDVYVGFSASTGSSTELNCVRSWFFDGSDLDDPGTDFRIWIMISIVVVLMLCFGGGYLYWRKKQKLSDLMDGENTIQVIESGLGPKRIKLKDLKTATGNFSAKNELGRGGFGIVYKGILEGIEVAVKRVINTPRGKQNLIAEVKTIGSIHHKNLVRLVGWCHEHEELILVYEYMPNRSLDHFIYINDGKEHKSRHTVLTWERRHSIICDVAQALDYLHNECSRRVLHRDIKASNIMLDSEFNACLGDFGLARMFQLNEKTHHSTKEIAGTPGYMAPEIFLTSRATSVTDVYAFGVLALVVACGKKAVFEIKDDEYRSSIIEWVWELYRLDKLIDAIDTDLRGKFNKEQAEYMLMLGLSCCHPNPYMRPSMRNALQVLMGEVLPPLVPYEKPAFIWPATITTLTRDDSTSGGVLTSFSSLIAR